MIYFRQTYYYEDGTRKTYWHKTSLAAIHDQWDNGPLWTKIEREDYDGTVRVTEWDNADVMAQYII